MAYHISSVHQHNTISGSLWHTTTYCHQLFELSFCCGGSGKRVARKRGINEAIEGELE
jgi:hypothetical protein